MNIIITGAGGQLGQALVRTLRAPTFYTIGFTRNEWDVTDPTRTTQLLASQPIDAVIHCAAYTNVDESERYPELAHRINAIATRHLAAECGKRGIRLVYISTDYVFNGNNRTGYVESDLPDPLNQYGKSKRLGEEWVEQFCPNHLILRTSWLYGQEGANFVCTILRKARQKEAISVVNDQVGAPTYTDHLAEQIRVLLSTPANGIFHTVNQGSCSWYQFAKVLLEQAGINYPIQAITSQQLQRPAVRPAYSVLRSERLEKEGYPLLPHWKEGLKHFLQREASE